MKFKIGKRNTNVLNNWEILNIGSYKIQKPVVLCLGGNCTISDREANFMSKHVQNLIGKSDDVDYISICYSHDHGRSGYLSTDDIFEIVDSLFVPLAMTEFYEMLPLEQACKNMRRVNIMAHCFGAREIVPSLEKAFASRLLILGYTDDEVKKIISQIFVASFVGGNKQKYVSSFQVKSITDKFYGREYIMEILTLKSNCDLGVADKLRVCHLQDLAVKKPHNIDIITFNFFKRHKYLLTRNENSVNLYTSQLTKCNSDHDISALHRDDYWRVRYETTKKGDLISQTFAYAIASAVVNSITNHEHSSFLPLDISQIETECASLLVDLREAKEETLKKEPTALVKA